ncbi:MAG: 5'/3'-nucleotidase SurE [Candidatus Cloacimonetes bacterium]|nr:5'/3'-nucleotidase SurE [Candidatus Cloacimonadota bacterium]
MNILLTNDDGINAPGLNLLADELTRRGHQITIVAPHEERSASSHSITIRKPLRVYKQGERRFSVTGTPVDCIFFATEMLAEKPIDLVISGINSGQNMAEDVLYSGTVAAAMEAMLLGYQAIAISIRNYRDQKFPTAAWWLGELLEKDICALLTSRYILNINVPDVELSAVRGIKTTRLGHREYQNIISTETDEQGETFYTIGGDVPEWELVPGTDLHAVHNNYISITPVCPEFTHTPAMRNIEEWVNNEV